MLEKHDNKSTIALMNHIQDEGLQPHCTKLTTPYSPQLLRQVHEPNPPHAEDVVLPLRLRLCLLLGAITGLWHTVFIVQWVLFDTLIHVILTEVVG